jgi:hypothetical protein
MRRVAASCAIWVLITTWCFAQFAAKADDGSPLHVAAPHHDQIDTTWYSSQFAAKVDDCLPRRFSADSPDNQIVARIGEETITARELKNNLDRLAVKREVLVMFPPATTGSFVRDALYEQAGQVVLNGLVDRRCIYAAAVSDLGQEAISQARTKCDEYFEKLELPELLKTYGVDNSAELEKKLSAANDSLANLRAWFFEWVIVLQWSEREIETPTDDPDYKRLYDEFLNNLKSRTKIWTVYDNAKESVVPAPQG